ncbi:tripartite tricarboxylate transporter TctB family protein [Xanthobacter wiegelii]|uniref:tripartite tricarboxylate transporter TctB family protein n=1 Tax=Xanthobacter wiegelii TaxID=3119913 RepID=UPI0037282F0E
MRLVKNPTNVLCGLVFLGLGGLFVLQASGLSINTSGQMGPGFFPLVLSGALGMFGVLLVGIGLRKPGTMHDAFAWRAFLMLVLAVVGFATAMRPLGFLPAVALSVLLAFLGSRRFSFRAAVQLCAGFTVFSWLVFIKGLGLPLQLLGPWLGGY